MQENIKKSYILVHFPALRFLYVFLCDRKTLQMDTSYFSIIYQFILNVRFVTPITVRYKNELRFLQITGIIWCRCWIICSNGIEVICIPLIIGLSIEEEMIIEDKRVKYNDLPSHVGISSRLGINNLKTMAYMIFN